MDLELLRKERIAKGITQEMMSKELGFKTKSSYNLMENGKTSISTDMAKKISDILELPPQKRLAIFLP